MTDTIRLRNYIDDKGVKLGYVANVLGITSNTLRLKLNNETEFKVSEADKLSSLLRLTRDERDACFFSHVS